MSNQPKKYQGPTLSEIKRKEVVDTAHRMFSEFDFNYISVSRIIQEANVAKQTFYNNFESKDALIFACIEMEIDRLKDELDRAVANTAEDSAYSKIQAIYNWHITYSKTHTGTLLSKAAIELRSFDSIRIQVEEFYDWKFKLIGTSLNQTNHRYLISDSNLKILFNLLNGILLPEKTIQFSQVPTFYEIEEFLTKANILSSKELS